MILTIFKIEHKVKKSQYFAEIFWLANISISIVLNMFFFILSNIIFNFGDHKLN